MRGLDAEPGNRQIAQRLKEAVVELHHMHMRHRVGAVRFAVFDRGEKVVMLVAEDGPPALALTELDVDVKEP